MKNKEKFDLYQKIYKFKENAYEFVNFLLLKKENIKDEYERMDISINLVNDIFNNEKPSNSDGYYEAIQIIEKHLEKKNVNSP